MILKIVIRLVAFLMLATMGATGIYSIRNMNYAKWGAARVKRAGFVEKQVDINGSVLNYAEGPANGPPLLLIHAQMADWQSWNRVLPELSRNFHIFAVDCYGHGQSDRVPEKYHAHALTTDLDQFISEVIGEAALIFGHSSGGLIAAGIAASSPEWVTGVILEDPRSSHPVLPRARKTFNYVALATTSHNFISSGEADFTSYHIRRDVLWDLFGGGKEWIQNQALRYRERHPKETLKLYFMPPAINEVFRGMESYDPRFGQAF